MQVYISNREIEQIAEGLIKVSCGNLLPKKVDIDGIAKYLGLSVVYEHIAEKGKDKIGFTSNGESPRFVLRNGNVEAVIFPGNTIVLEWFLQDKKEEHRRRFVLAHEVGHVVLDRADPAYDGAAYFNRVYDEERYYSAAELHERMNLRECQANTFAAFILMPRAVVKDSVMRHFGADKIPVYGDCVFSAQNKPLLKKMSEELGVSYSAMVIQLRKYNLLEQHSMNEYFKETLAYGGRLSG